MIISWFRHKITPEVGTMISGYGMFDVSTSKFSDLFMTGLLADDGERRVLLISMDLQCMDVEYIQKFRKLCASHLEMDPASVMLCFTHTHGGPQTNSEPDYVDHLNIPYMEMLEKALDEECGKLAAAPQNRECNVYCYSINVDANLNRRVVLADNYDAFMPHRAELRKMSQGFRDQELGCLYFIPVGEKKPVFILGNYAAHPLASHGIGEAAYRISADYPGEFCDYVSKESGAVCMFVSGALGDMVPADDEMGGEAAHRMGVKLAEGAFRGFIDATRNPERFKMKSERVGAKLARLRVPLRQMYQKFTQRICNRDRGKKEIEMELQCLAIGEVCFVGVPGEWVAELGAEVKWHSPFRKAFIAFSATEYRDYMVPANFMLQGGYEAYMTQFDSRKSIEIVKTAVDAMFDLRDELYPMPEGAVVDYNTLVNQYSIAIRKELSINGQWTDPT